MNNQQIQQQTQRQAQQRQILSQMGVDWWISTKSLTKIIVTDNPVEVSIIKCTDVNVKVPNTSMLSSTDSIDGVRSFVSSNLVEQSDYGNSKLLESKLPKSKSPKLNSDKIIDSLTTSQTSNQDVNAGINEADNSSSINQSTSQVINSVVTEVSLSAELKNQGDGKETIRPFQLQAVHYGNWVLLVDSEFLQADKRLDNGIEELWQNLYQALDKPVETLKFPLVTDMKMVAMSTEPMDTVELANATLAGFIFKMVKTEEVKLASLTELSEGLDDERLVRLPLLNEMMAEPQLKKKFWQLLHS